MLSALRQDLGFVAFFPHFDLNFSKCLSSDFISYFLKNTVFFLQLPQVSLLPPPPSIQPEVATEGFPGRLGMVHVTKIENI